MNFTLRRDDSLGELQAGRDIEAVLTLLIKARRSIRNSQMRRLLDELEIDIRGLSDQQFLYVHEELHDK